MNEGYKNGFTERVIALIAELGPMGTAEVARHFGVPKARVSRIFSRGILQHRRTPQRFYIERWVFDDESARSYPRAVYALGDKKHAKRPPAQTRKQIKARHHKVNWARKHTASVFNRTLLHKVSVRGE